MERHELGYSSHHYKPVSGMKNICLLKFFVILLMLFLAVSVFDVSLLIPLVHNDSHISLFVSNHQDFDFSKHFHQSAFINLVTAGGDVVTCALGSAVHLMGGL